MRRSVSFLSRLREDIDTARAFDPAARSDVEIVVNYSGLHAIWLHRLSHRLWEREQTKGCLLYTSPSPRDRQKSRMPSSA